MSKPITYISKADAQHLTPCTKCTLLRVIGDINETKVIETNIIFLHYDRRTNAIWVYAPEGATTDGIKLDCETYSKDWALAEPTENLFKKN